MKNWIETEENIYNQLWTNGYKESIMDDVQQFFPELFSDKTKKVLDLGCGNAYLSKFFDKYNGIDISSEVIKQNTKKHGQYYHGSISDLRTFYDEPFDKIICFDVLEHIPPIMIGLVLSEISRLNYNRGYFKIHRGRSTWTDEDGNQLHRTIGNQKFWKETVTNFFNIDLEIHKDLLSFYKVSPKNCYTQKHVTK